MADIDPLLAKVDTWLRRDPDPQTRKELKALVAAGAHDEIRSRFATRLAFGTAGLRGLMGTGPNRMNRLVVRETTAGLGQYLIATVDCAKKRGVVVGYDGRCGSRDFAHDAATVLRALGFRVFLGDHVLPTPVCAFGVLHHQAAAGIVITASHNPAGYNGYKVYWDNGAQIIPPHDANIAKAIVEAATHSIPWISDFNISNDTNPIVPLGHQLTADYLRGVAQLLGTQISTAHHATTIAYTPLHGVGASTAEAALEQAGFAHVHTVVSQREPDGMFPTVHFPNPEEPGAMDAVLACAQEVDADLAMANDPDADRLAVAVRTHDGYRMLTGDQIGVLLGERMIELHPGPETIVARTIVSSRMLGAIAQIRGVQSYETLTGFKWIANEAIKQQALGKSRFVFGYEEALGYALGDRVRDKDGISAMVAFAQLAAHCKAQGHTVLDRLDLLYAEVGLYTTDQCSLWLRQPHPPNIGDRLRAAPPTHIAGVPIAEYIDYKDGVKGLPPADVLQYIREDGVRVIVRPSGTEPKLKCYYEAIATLNPQSNMASMRTQAVIDLRSIVKVHQSELLKDAP